MEINLYIKIRWNNYYDDTIWNGWRWNTIKRILDSSNLRIRILSSLYINTCHCLYRWNLPIMPAIQVDAPIHLLFRNYVHIFLYCFLFLLRNDLIKHMHATGTLVSAVQGRISCSAVFDFMWVKSSSLWIFIHLFYTIWFFLNNNLHEKWFNGKKNLLNDINKNNIDLNKNLTYETFIHMKKYPFMVISRDYLFSDVSFERRRIDRIDTSWCLNLAVLSTVATSVLWCCVFFINVLQAKRSRTIRA